MELIMKKVLVTGVSKGIGRAIAERFLKEGYFLYGTFFRDQEKAEELIKQYGENKVKLIGPYDFTKTDEVEKFINNVKNVKDINNKTNLLFDSIICSAGIFNENDDFNNFDLNEFNKTMNCNFYAPLMICIELKDTIKKGGSIVLMSSNDAYPGAYSSISYTISKAAVISLMKCLCVNLGKRQIRVNSVAPGAIDTDMNTPEQMNIAPYFTPINRAGKPIDVAKVVYFLASEEAAFISGENVTIDGGYNIVSVLLKSEADPKLSKNLQKFIPKSGFKPREL